GSRSEPAVVASECGEQYVPLNLAGQRVNSEERIDTLEVSAGGEQHGCAAACRRRLTGREHKGGEHRAEQMSSSHGERYRAAVGCGQVSWRLRQRMGRLHPMPLRALSRLVSAVAVVIGVVTLMFFLLHLAPGDPARLLVGPTATPEQVEAQRHTLGLDRPLPQQYASWLGRLVQGDWGISLATGRPVRGMLADAWPATVKLVGLSLLLSYAL